MIPNLSGEDKKFSRLKREDESRVGRSKRNPT